MRKLPIIVALLALLPCLSKAQTTVNSDGVSVRNSAPANVFFVVPVGSNSNITEFQLGCSDSAVNRNYVFIYEEQPNGQIVTYPFSVEVDCNEAYGSGGTTYTASLKSDITVTTPDHVITIKQSTAWTASKTGYRGSWVATGGSSQIVVQ